MAAEAANMVNRYGFRTLKIKGGQSFDVDLAGIREIRSAVDDSIRFYVDANGAYRMDQALDYARALADAGIAILEDPCPLSPDMHFEKLRHDSPIPILVDFGSTSLRDAGLFLERGAQALSAKPGRFGLTHARAMQDLAQQKNCAVVAGLMGESALGTLAGLQFAATIAKPVLPAELTWYLAMTEQIVRDVPAITGGVLQLPDQPSLASRVDWDALKKSEAKRLS
jgi:L-alanine-DL-glutamate epimerase-like enolase superfamily enzyme